MATKQPPKTAPTVEKKRRVTVDVIMRFTVNVDNMEPANVGQAVKEVGSSVVINPDPRGSVKLERCDISSCCFGPELDNA